MKGSRSIRRRSNEYGSSSSSSSTIRPSPIRGSRRSDTQISSNSSQSRGGCGRGSGILSNR
eukprot:9359479-Pyramimonas_sp.AAC.1